MAKRFLTLDIGAANIALAEYEASAKGALTLVRYATAPLEAPAEAGDPALDLTPVLQELARANGIKPGPVALSVSGQMVFPRFAAIPQAGGDEKFEQQVRFEIEQNIPFPIDEMVCDRQILGDTESGDKSVMIVAAKTDQIEAIAAAVTAAGFAPALVDVAPLAVVNAVRATMADDACVIVLDIGAKTTSLVIADGERLYNRSVPVAGNTLTREIAASLGCSPEEAEAYKCSNGYVALGGVVEDDDQTADQVSKVCRAVMTRLNAEISRSVNFYRSQQGGSAPVRLYLTGGSALLPQIDRFFAENLGIEVVFFNPFDAIAVGAAVDAEALSSDGAMLAATAGVALHASGLALYQIDLMPPSIVASRAERARIPVLAVAAAALLAAFVGFYLAASRSAETAATANEALDGCVTRLKGFETKIKAATAAVEADRAKADSFRELLLSRSAQVSRLAAVRAALAGNMWIERWEGNKVVIRGWRDDVEALLDADGKAHGGKRRTASEIVVANLKGSPAVDAAGIRISDISSVGKNGEIEQFTLEVAFK